LEKLFIAFFLYDLATVVIHAKAKNNHCCNEDEHYKLMIEKGSNSCTTTEKSGNDQK
jgi:hypothetical protein